MSFFNGCRCCKKRDPFQGLRMGSCLTLGNELSEETHMLTKQEILLGKGTQENCSAMWLAVSGLMVMGLVSGLSLANHSDSESFLVVHALFSQDGCQREGFWEVVGQVVSPFDLSRTFLVGGGLLVPCSFAQSLPQRSRGEPQIRNSQIAICMTDSDLTVVPDLCPTQYFRVIEYLLNHRSHVVVFVLCQAATENDLCFLCGKGSVLVCQ